MKSSPSSWGSDAARALAVAVALASAPSAHAQLLSDGFEGGALDGGWYILSTRPGVTFGVRVEAAHRGSFGARSDDTETALTLTQATTAEIQRTRSLEQIYFRMWHRLSGWSRSGGNSLVAVSSDTATLNSIAIDDQSRLFLVTQPTLADGGSGYERHDSAFPIEDAGWVLIEGMAWALEGRAWAARYSANGTVLGSVDGGGTISPSTVTRLAIGSVFQHSGTGYRARQDYDDLALDETPLPSRFAVETAVAAAESGCGGFDLTLRSTFPLPDGGDPGPLRAPYEVNILVDAGTALFLDPACATAQSQFKLPMGTRASRAYARVPVSGVLQIDAVDGPGPNDFLPVRAAVDLRALPAGDPDGGGAGSTPTGPRDLIVGCGCGTAPGTLFSLALAIALVRRRRQDP